MNPDLEEEIEYVKDLLVKSGFFDVEEIREILEDQFIEEEIDFSKRNIYLNDSDNINFNRLERVFEALASEDIVAIHNCGYDLDEGVGDAFELYVHLKNNKFSPKGFCFYSFEDIEYSIWDEKLKITFGDFENSEEKALEIGKIVEDYLKAENFSIIWDGTVNNQIEINPFKWDKSFDGDKDYEIEGAYEVFINRRC
ncbi:DUF6891 domain-containing protein [Methanobrevibacter sp.]|uniref:DUF6891 domain-containing protein n=1 Tax=Methanobrevibacter sp. TaxID=66852 RepID=UPI0025EE77EC|nr:hypothetical protein [Methanobrevibacter sp.]MBQ2832602.1 hypothetical protein [Methanobrevibacter sp.]